MAHVKNLFTSNNFFGAGKTTSLKHELHVNKYSLFNNFFYIVLDVQQNTIISHQTTTTTTPPNVHSTVPLPSTTSLLCDSTVSSFPSGFIQGRKTAAIVPSTIFPGVDVVIYETVDNHQF
jgi:hypothetical protein